MSELKFAVGSMGDNLDNIQVEQYQDGHTDLDAWVNQYQGVPWTISKSDNVFVVILCGWVGGTQCLSWTISELKFAVCVGGGG